jgi:hypothetical protein
MRNVIGCESTGYTPTVKELIEVRNSGREPLGQRNGRLPPHLAAGQSDVGAALPGFVGRERVVHQRRPRPDEVAHQLGQLPHSELAGVPEVHGARDVIPCTHEPYEPLDEVVHVAEGARLRAVPVQRDGLVAQRLHDEVGYHPPIVRVHAQAVGIEDARHLDAQPVLAPVVEEQRLGAPLPLVVAGADANRIHVHHLRLGLGVHLRVAVHLAGGRPEDLGPDALGQPQHVDGAVHAGLGGLDRIVLVVHRRGRARQVVDLVHLHVQREGDVVTDELEARVLQYPRQVVAGAGEEVVHRQDVTPVVEQPLAQVRAQKAGPPGYKNARSETI